MQNNPPDNQVTSQEYSSAPIQPQTISWMSYADKDNSLQGSSPTRLGKLIAQIYRDENIDQVEIVLQKVENARSRYEKSEFFYRAFLPGPPLLVRQLKQLLNSNKVTRQLTETLDPDYIALLTYNVFIWSLVNFFVGDRGFICCFIFPKKLECTLVDYYRIGIPWHLSD
jgi:hypothetical protein